MEPADGDLDILLVNPDHGQGRRSHPWGVLSLGSYLTSLRDKAYRVKIIDASVQSRSSFFDELRHYCPATNLVGISFMSPDAYFVTKVIDFVKAENTACRIVVGGPHPTLFPEQTCAHENIDFLAYAEGEQTTALLIEQMRKGSHGFREVPGLIYKDGATLIRTPPADPVAFYDIDYDLLPNEVQDELPNYAQVLTGRGCSFKCTFCYNSVCGQKWRGRPMGPVMDEVRRLVQKHDSKVVYFRDEDFFFSKPRAKDFVSLYRAGPFSFRWQATCRTSHFNRGYIDPTFLRELKQINCEELRFGLESGSQRVLNFLKKGVKAETSRRVVRDVHEAGIRGNYSFIMGVPGETYEDYRMTMELVKHTIDCAPEAVILGPQFYRIYPGGELHEHIEATYRYDQPRSLEGWAETTNPSLGRSNSSPDYPWLPRKHKLLAQEAHLLATFYQQDVSDFLRLSEIVNMPFYLLARLRFRFGRYDHLYEMAARVLLRKLKRLIKSLSLTSKSVPLSFR
jgi:radical SAM superfamily enzyme YgiQ (UPF0313 family)